MSSQEQQANTERFDVPALRSPNPPVFANQVQLVGMGGFVLLEFRAVFPDPDAMANNGIIDRAAVAVDANPVSIPAHTRLVLPTDIAFQLKEILAGNIIVNVAEH